MSGNTSPLAGLSDLEFIRRVVIQGSIKMPPMRTMLTKRQIEQVSKFVFPERDNAWWSDTKANARVLLLAIKKRDAFKSKIH